VVEDAGVGTPAVPSLQKVLRVDIEAGWDLQAGQDRASRSQGLATLGADEELDAREPLQSLERGGSRAQELDAGCGTAARTYGWSASPRAPRVPPPA
jgi:hypothetical protein